MSTPKLLSLFEIVQQALQRPKGTFKVMAALGDLLAVDSMVNLCAAVGYWNAEKYSAADRERVNEVDMRAYSRVNEAWRAFQATTDPEGSKQFISVLREATRELRGLVEDVDFWNDEVVDPWGGVP